MKIATRLALVGMLLSPIPGHAQILEPPKRLQVAERIHVSSASMTS